MLVGQVMRLPADPPVPLPNIHIAAVYCKAEPKCESAPLSYLLLLGVKARRCSYAGIYGKKWR